MAEGDFAFGRYIRGHDLARILDRIGERGCEVREQPPHRVRRLKVVEEVEMETRQFALHRLAGADALAVVAMPGGRDSDMPLAQGTMNLFQHCSRMVLDYPPGGGPVNRVR